MASNGAPWSTGAILAFTRMVEERGKIAAHVEHELRVARNGVSAQTVANVAVYCVECHEVLIEVARADLLQM